MQIHRTEMGHQHMQNQDTNLNLSSDTKPRLKWTPQLHHQFVDAVTQLGGADNATPKTLMRMMGIPELTLYHLKSHLQKYRLGKSQQSETYHDNKQEDEGQSNLGQRILGYYKGLDYEIIRSMPMARALQMQMDVQRKLHEQIEVQRHLQLRIEAQGKYLQSVLKKAQETLSGYDSSSVGVELAKAELYQLVSMVDNGCLSSSLSVQKDIRCSISKYSEKSPMGGTGCSLESSFTSSESSGQKEEKKSKHESGGDANSVVLSLTDMNPRPKEKRVPSNQISGRKRSESTISDGDWAEQPSGKHSHKTGDQLTRFGLMETFDLNIQYLTDFDSGPKAIDLN
ncbi:hypothetical protein CsSME_00043634 [Camellia sinensis var. sinensis]